MCVDVYVCVCVCYSRTLNVGFVTGNLVREKKIVLNKMEVMVIKYLVYAMNACKI
eukprot:m.51956 g.51956  ORF g.51956 m.51956 type:complete len:55 (+) comp7590_c1_seq4:1743-1907(+)